MCISELLSVIHFRPTNYANDNIALLEAGFNKEIDKNTTLLLKQEKETDVYQAIKTLLEKDASNTLHPEMETANPAYKLFLKFKAENVSVVVMVVYNKQHLLHILRVPWRSRNVRKS